MSIERRQIMSGDANLTVMRRFFELANRHDVDRLLELVHRDYVGDGECCPSR
jgi:hypothetical protein